MGKQVIIILFFLMITMCIGTNVYANADLENTYLMQILNQLEAIKPLVLAAAKEQPKNNRYQFHYTAFTDRDGNKHAGLLEDIHAIEKGILEKIKNIPAEGHHFQPIAGDYSRPIHIKGEMKDV